MKPFDQKKVVISITGQDYPVFQGQCLLELLADNKGSSFLRSTNKERQEVLNEDEFYYQDRNGRIQYLQELGLISNEVILTYNSQLQQIHIETSLQKSLKKHQYLNERENYLFKTGKQYILTLAHSHVCGSQRFSRIRTSDSQFDQGFTKVASGMVVQDQTGCVLLTKRSKQMRVFPNAWVVPGGHIDPGESLEDGVIRELHEETGIYIKRKGNILTYNEQEVLVKPYFAYESSIAQWDEQTQFWTLEKCPIGHLIIYFQVQLKVPSNQIILKLEPQEVDSSVWLDLPFLKKALNSQSENKVVKGLDSKTQLEKEFLLSEIFPFYPNAVFSGLGKSSALALQFLLQFNFNTAKL